MFLTKFAKVQGDISYFKSQVCLPIFSAHIMEMYISKGPSDKALHYLESGSEISHLSQYTNFGVSVVVVV